MRPVSSILISWVLINIQFIFTYRFTYTPLGVIGHQARHVNRF